MIARYALEFLLGSFVLLWGGAWLWDKYKAMKLNKENKTHTNDKINS